ncbi:MAG TPA: glutamyl-tRNA reductase [Fibrobacteria bacterium]|nr:glutamyl-tRNA reductase [Fibrobacteria bacterium]
MNSSHLQLFVLGVSHRTAPVSLRDRLLFHGDELPAFVDGILLDGLAGEAVMLSTCNRSEIYGIAHAHPGAASPPHTAVLGERLTSIWSAQRGVEADALRKHGYFLSGDDAVRHLFRVIGSLDSLVLGEVQILGQVKEAYQFATERRWTDFYLNRVFQAGLHAGKRIHAETAVHEGAVSISYAAVELARKVLGDLRGKTAGLIGTGEMGELAAQHLHRAGVRDFHFFNRSPGSAARLAESFDGQAHGLDELPTRMASCDIIISATGAADIVVTAALVREAARARYGNPLFLIDIAAPGDIDPAAGEVDNTFLFTIDDLKAAVEENAGQRREAARAAEAIVDEEADRLAAWVRTLDVVPTLKTLRARYREIAEREIARHSAGLPPEMRERMAALGHGLLNKFLHAPTTRLKKMAARGEAERAGYYAGELFNLNISDLPRDPPSSAPVRPEDVRPADRGAPLPSPAKAPVREAPAASPTAPSPHADGVDERTS